jgi:arylsulfatase A-like enzyme
MTIREETMSRIRSFTTTLCLLLTALLVASPATAQQVTGTLGSPSATTSISAKQLPAPDPAFGGVIKDDALQSTPWWAPRIVPPKGAPNVLLIITDDAGFGVPSTFGGVIPTPTMDRIANEGLRYNRVFSTALCSPTRAALITGRNHHSAGFGVISEQSTGFPGYNSIIGKDKATIGRILLDNGYSTAWFGKDHNTPAFAASQVGPFDQWPTGMGFEYFYGFVGGDANQWQPNLFRNTTQIYPFEGKPGWNLITGMADDAIDYMTRIHQTDPSKPIFIKYAPGATHAPHHPTREWVEKIRAMHLFDDGYNKLRETIFENQKKLGVIAKDAKLTPWPNELLKPWDQLGAEEKKLFIRQVEIFAAYAAYNDHEIGRVIQSFADLGRLDNTLIIYINGDNGTSAEGGPLGTPNEVAFFNGLNEIPVDVQMKFYDVWGTELTYNHMSAGWSWAFDTPFDWFKQNASRLGGINQNMVVYTKPMVGLPQGDSPFLLDASYTITAEITVPEGGAEGMILTSGGRFAGYGFYLLKGKPVFLWNLVDLMRIKWEGPEALAAGKHTLEFDFTYDGLGLGTLAFNNMSGLGRPGTGTLKVDGKDVQTINMKRTLPMILQWDESFDIGSDTLTGVNDTDYKPPFPLTAKLNKLTIKVDRPELTPEDIKKLDGAQAEALDGKPLTRVQPAPM